MTALGDPTLNRVSEVQHRVPRPRRAPGQMSEAHLSYGVSQLTVWAAKQGPGQSSDLPAGARGWAAKQGPDPSFR